VFCSWPGKIVLPINLPSGQAKRATHTFQDWGSKKANLMGYFYWKFDEYKRIDWHVSEYEIDREGLLVIKYGFYCICPWGKVCYQETK